MRKSLLTFILSALLLIPLGGYARSFNVTFHNDNVEQALNVIKKETGYDIVYRKDLIKGINSVINGDYRNTSLDDLLANVVTAQMGLTYEVIENTVILRKPSASSSDANISVSGKITDENGDPIAGATVLLAGSRKGVATDVDGRFSIASVPSTGNLTVSYIGYKGESFPINGRTEINVSLTPDRLNLDEVVVTGYQTISRERATGSFDIIDKKQLQKATPNIAQRLIGAAAGLTSSQDIYGNPSFEIRGASSYFAAGSPLLVVDGFPIESGYGSINPNDVESVTVLKDAAAASIWGAKSANGVIVITTKNGNYTDRTNVSIDYSGLYKTSPKMDLDYVLNRAASDDLIDYQVDTFNKWGASNFYISRTTPEKSPSNVFYLLNDHRLGLITEEEMNAGIAKYRGIDNQQQLSDNLLQNPMVMQHNLSIGVQTSRSTTNLSLLFQDTHSYWKNDDEKKYMFSVNNRVSIYKWLDFSFNGVFNYNQNRPNGIHGLPQLASFENLYDENGDLIRYTQINPNYLDAKNYTGKFPYDWTWNPLDDPINSEHKNTVITARANTGLTFKIWKGLTYDARLQYELQQGNNSSLYKEDSYQTRYRLNTTSTYDSSTGTVTQNLPSGAILNRSSSRVTVTMFRNQLNFNHTFAKKHTVALAAGIETTNRVAYNYTYPTVYGFNPATLQYGQLPVNTEVKNWYNSKINLATYSGFSERTDRYFSAFGNLSYTFDNKYTVSGSYRTDASNLITDDPKYRYAPFWSAGAGWQLGKEKFLNNLTWIDRLNLRLTYGFNGNVLNASSFKPLISTSSTTNYYTGEFTGNIDSYGNPTLRWEKAGTWNLGLDYALMGGKLFGKIDFYNKMSQDLYCARDISAVNGTTNQWFNNGKILNRGIEIEVGSSLDITRNIAWTGTLRLSYNYNRIKKLDLKDFYARNMVNGGTYAWVEGMNMYNIWCYEYAGLVNEGSEENPVWEPAVWYNGEKIAITTNYNNLNDDAREFLKCMGTTMAPWQASVSSSFRIYDFDLSFILTGKFGHKFRRTGFNYPAPNATRYTLNKSYYEVLNCDPSVMIPLPQQDNESRYYYWDRYYPYVSYLVADASHIRMQEISLTYSLPRNILNILGMKGLQVTAQTNNPFNIYFNKYHEDPEFKKGDLRLQSSYTVGLKLNF